MYTKQMWKAVNLAGQLKKWSDLTRSTGSNVLCILAAAITDPQHLT